MARHKFTEEERREIALEIANYIIEENALNYKVSTRLLSDKFGVSNYTISILMGDYLNKHYPELYKKVNVILKGNIPKTVENIEIKKRVLEAARLTVLGLTISEIAIKLNVSEYVIQEDLQTRLKKIDIDLYDEITYIHNQNRKNNLQSGNDLYIEQTRDQYGHFGGKK